MPLHFRVAWQLVVKFLLNVGNPLNLARPLLGLISVLKCLAPIKFDVALLISLDAAKFVDIEQSYQPNVASLPHFAEFDEYPPHLSQKVRSQLRSKLDVLPHSNRLLAPKLILSQHCYQIRYFDQKDKLTRSPIFAIHFLLKPLHFYHAPIRQYSPLVRFYRYLRFEKLPDFLPHFLANVE